MTISGQHLTSHELRERATDRHDDVIDLRDHVINRREDVIDLRDLDPTEPPDVPAEPGPRRRVEVRPVAAVAFAGVTAAGVWFIPGAVVFLAMLSLLVILHEGAHLLAARRCGMHCSEFAIGFGPRVAAVRAGELEVGLRLFPAGGFVKITGMTRSEEVADHLEGRTYRAARLRSKLAVVLAGPLANLAAGFVIAVLAFAAISSGQGDAEHPVAQAADFTGALFTTSFEGYADLVGDLGDYPEMLTSGGTEGDATRVLSPVSASQFAGHATEAGFAWLALYAAIISVALGAFNLVPIVPLDGGQAAVAITEWAGTRLRGRPVVIPTTAVNVASYALVGFLVLLSASAVYLDVVDPHANPFTG